MTICLSVLLAGAIATSTAYADEAAPVETEPREEQVVVAGEDGQAAEVPAEAPAEADGAAAVEEPPAAEPEAEPTPAPEAAPAAEEPQEAAETVADAPQDGAADEPAAATPQDEPAAQEAAPAEADAPAPADEVLESQAGTVTPSSKEKDPTTYDASKLLEDGTVYAISRTSGGTVVVSGGSKTPKLASTTDSLEGYWRISNLGEGRYQLVSMKDGSLLTYAADGSTVTTGTSGVWLLLSRLNGSFSLVPESFTDSRLQALGTKDGAGLALRDASASDAQGFFFTLATWLTTAATKGTQITEGIYALDSAVGGSQVVQVAGGSVATGANVATNAATGAVSQRWRFVSVGNNLYVIQAVHSGMVLDVAGGATTAKSNVCQSARTNVLSQLWYLTKSGTEYLIRNAKSGLGLSVQGGKAANGTNVRLYNANTTASQRFGLVRDAALEQSIKAGKPFAEGIYSIATNLDKGFVVTVGGSSTANRANIQLSSAADALSQKVELTYLGYGLYMIQFANSGKYLNIDGSAAAGSNVCQADKASGSRNQQWFFVKCAGGWQLYSAVSGLALNIEGGKAVEGANVNVWNAVADRERQSFMLTQVPLIKNGTYVLSSALSPAQLLEVRNNSKKVNGNVQINRMRRKANAQRWVITYLGNGRYKIVNRRSKLSLDVSKGSRKRGANVLQRRYRGTARQQWVLGIDDTGAITIKNVRSGIYLDLAKGKSASGTNVRQWTRLERKRQGFVPYSVSSTFVKAGKTGYQNPSQYYQISAYSCVLPSYAHGFYTYVSKPVLSPTATRRECVEAFIKRAYDFLGTKYMWDWAMAPGQGVDCAGLVMQCLYACGIQTPYNTYDHMFDPWQDHNAENMRADKKFKKVPFSQRQRGDLIFYKGHVGIYLGNDKIINAYEPKVKVQSVYSWTVTGCSRVFV